MEQTKDYKFNLIEMSDTFSTEPLNENMEAVEDALNGVKSAASALTSRVSSLEHHRVAAGTYTGSSTNVTVNVGFAPRAVVIGGNVCNLIVADIGGGEGYGTGGRLTYNGFEVMGDGAYCRNGYRYNYLAIR